MRICHVFWDHQSYTLSDSNNGYSIENSGGIPYSLKWDLGEHIINNPQSYSYSTIASGSDCQRLRIWYRYVDARGWTWENDIDIAGKFLGFKAEQNPNNPIFYINFVNCRALYTNPCQNQEFRQFPLTTRSNPVTYLRTETLNGLPINSFTLKIIDDNQEYFYDINDINSIQTIHNNGENNIIIEGHSFPINDVDSARKECDNECPPNTHACTCGNRTCCYELRNDIYYSVKSFFNN